MANSSQLTQDELHALVATERINSAVSIVGIFFIISTYLGSPYFNKPINRLIFFATWSNLGTNVASLISTAGYEDGPTKPLCQLQGFCVQMFLGVDAYWAFCMAINVYLAFFQGWTVKQLRSLDMRYLIACYGLSFIPAITFLFVKTREGDKIYGQAVIWCWITEETGFLRIITLYAIVWLAILFAAIIYTFAIRAIWRKRSSLDGFLNPMNEHPFSNVVTTEIEITHESRPMAESAGPVGISDIEAPADYSVQVQAKEQPTRPLPDALRMRTVTREVASNEPNAEAWLYARVAILFFIALLVTWIPSSVNRLYALARPTHVNFGLNYVSSFVFPLQGFWNVLVYIITSQTACRRLWADLSHRSRTAHLGGNLTGGKNVGKRLGDGTPGMGRGQRLQSLSSLSG